MSEETCRHCECETLLQQCETLLQRYMEQHGHEGTATYREKATAFREAYWRNIPPCLVDTEETPPGPHATNN